MTGRSCETFWAILWTVLLVVSPIAGAVTATTGPAATAPRTTQPDIDQLQERPVDSNQQIRPSLSQSVSFSPNATSQTLPPNGTYPILVSVAIESTDLLTEDKVTDPGLDISLSGTGVEIERAVSLDSDYETTRCPSSTQCSVSSDTPFLPETEHNVLVYVNISGEPSDEFSISATPIQGGTDGETATATYDVVDTGTGWESMARAARQRATIAKGYQSTYQTLVYHEPWNETYQKAMRDAFTTVITEQAKTLTLGRVNHASSAADAADVYKMTQSEYAGGPVGEIGRTTIALKEELFSRIETDRVQRAGNVSEPLARLATLYQKEAQAWQNKNREQALEYIQKQRAILVGSCVGTGAREHYPSTDYDQCLAIEADDQYLAASSQTHLDFFSSVRDFAYAELTHGEEYVLPVARQPNPSATTERSRSELAAELAALEPGDSLQVNFTVANGGNAGRTSNQGYLSFSYPESISVTAVQASGNDANPPSVRHHRPGDSVYGVNGSRRRLTHNLTDVWEAFNPGERNQYTVTFEKTTGGEAWVAYRAAFEPLLHVDSQRSFVRYPASDDYPTDQQGWRAINITASDTGTTRGPRALATASTTTVSAGDSVTLDASASTVADGTRSIEWRLDTNGDDNPDIVRDQARISETLSQAGKTMATAVVRNGSGGTDRTTIQITVRRDRSPDASFHANRSVLEPGQQVTFTATGDASTVEWDLDGDGTYDEATGKAVTKTFDVTGEQTVGVRVTTSDGSEATSTTTYQVESLTERVNRPRPVVDAPTTVDPGVGVQFNASASTDRSIVNSSVVPGEITSYEWAFGTSETVDARGARVTHAFSQNGTKTVTLTVHDNQSNSATVTRTVTVGDSSDGGDDGDSGRAGEPLQCQAGEKAISWPSVRRDARLTGQNTGCGPVSNVHIEWQHSPSGDSYRDNMQGQLVGADGQLFAADSNTIYAYNASTGQVVWQDNVGSNGIGGLAIANGKVIATISGARVVALSTSDGSQEWEIDLSPDSSHGDMNAPTVAEDQVYITSEGGRLSAVWQSNGTVQWNTTITGNHVDTPAVSGDLVYAVASENLDGSVRAYHRQNGTQRWQTGLSTMNVELAAFNNQVYTETPYRIAGFNATTGTKQQMLTGSSSPPVVGSEGNYLYTLGPDGVQELNESTGATTWEYPIGDPVEQPLATKNAVYYRTVNDQLIAVSRDSGAGLWSLNLSDTPVVNGIEAAPILLNETLYTVTTNGTVVAIDGNQTYDITRPEIGIEASDTTPFARQEVTLSVTDTGDDRVENRFAAYEWTIAGTDKTGRMVTHTFDTTGTKQVSLTVTTANGDTFTVRRDLSVKAFDSMVTSTVEWPQAGGGQANTGAVGRQVPASLSQGWNRSAGAESASVVTTETAVYQATGSQLAKYHKNGSRQWQLDLGDGTRIEAIRGQPAVGPSGTVYVSLPDGIAAVASNGSLQWETATQASWDCDNNERPCISSVSAPTVTEDGLFVTASPWDSQRTDLYKLSLDDGTVQWHQQLRNETSEATFAPAVDVSGNVYATVRGGGLYSFTASGTQRWHAPGSETDRAVSRPVVTPNGTVLFTSSGTLTAFNSASGEEAWSITSETRVAPAVGASGRVYVPINKTRMVNDHGIRILTPSGDTASTVRYPPQSLSPIINARQYDAQSQPVIGPNGRVAVLFDSNEESEYYPSRLVVASTSGRKVTTRLVGESQELTPLAPGFLLTTGQDGLQVFGGGPIEETPLDAELTVTPQIPSSRSSLSASAEASTGTGTLTYTWYKDGEKLRCSGPVCEIPDTYGTYEYPVTVSVAVTQADGQTDRTSMTVQPSEIDLDAEIDGSESGDYVGHLLASERLGVALNTSAVNHEIVDIQWNVSGTATKSGSGESIVVTPTGTAALNATATVTLEASNGAQTTRTESVEMGIWEFRGDRTEHFTFTYRNPPTDRWRGEMAILQAGVEAKYRAVAQRTDGLPETIQVTFVRDANLDSYCHPRAGACAKPPNQIYLPYDLVHLLNDNPQTGSLVHEMTHVAQFTAGSNSNGAWEFFMEGHAEYEESHGFWTDTIEKPSMSDLRTFHVREEEYTEASNFVSAFARVYGRQAILEMVRRSDEESFETAFKDVTGERVDSFYDRWTPANESTGPNAIRTPSKSNNGENIFYKPMFVYQDGTLTALTAASEVYAIPTSIYDLPDRITVRWDTDDDGQYEQTGREISWYPPTTGQHSVTLQYETTAGTLTQTQTFTVKSIPAPSVSLDSTAGRTVKPGHTLDVVVDGPALEHGTVTISGTNGVASRTIDASSNRVTTQVALSNEGETAVTVSATNDRGYTTTRTYEFTVRDTPRITSLTPEDGSLVNGSESLVATYADATSGINASAVSLRVDGSTVPVDAGGSELSVPLSELQLDQGTHDLTVTVADNAGFTTRRTVSVTLDSAAPSVSTFDVRATTTRVGPNAPATITAGLSDLHAGSATLQITGPNGDVVHEETLTNAFSGTATVEWSPVTGGTPVPSGTYTAEVTAVDAAGNTRSATRTFTVDTTPPGVSVKTLEAARGATIAADTDGRLSTAGPMTVTVAADGTPTDPSNTSVSLRLQATFANFEHRVPATYEDGLWTATIDPASIPDDGVYRVTATATDPAANQNQTTAEATVDLDRSAPTLSTSVNALNESAVALTVTSTEPLAGPPAVTVRTPDGDRRQPPLQETTTGWEAIFNTDTNGRYELTVTGRDAAGNTERATASTLITSNLKTTNRTVRIENPDTGTILDLHLNATLQDGTGTVTESSVPLAALTEELTGTRFLSASFGSHISEHIVNATIAIPVNTTELPNGVSQQAVGIRYYDSANESWVPLSPTRIETRTSPTGVNRSYWVTTVPHFSTYGAVVEDTTPPRLTSASPTNSSLQAAPETVPVRFEYTDALTAVNVTSVTLTVDGQPVTQAPNTTITSEYAQYTMHKPESGEHRATLTVSDAAGNTETYETTFMVSQDTTPPTIASVTPANGTTLSADTSTVTFVARYDDMGAGVATDEITVSINGTAVTEQASINETHAVYTARSLKPGTTYTFTVSVPDASPTRHVARADTQISIAAPTNNDNDGEAGTGGGGGGGGQSSMRIDHSNLDDYHSVTITSPESLTDIPLEISDGARIDGMGVQQLDIRAMYQPEEITMYLYQPTESPELDVARLHDATPVSYFRVSLRWTDSKHIGDVTTHFTVPEDELSDSTSESNVVLYQYQDGEWQALSTSHVEETMYRAHGDGVGQFAIGIQSAPEGKTTQSTPTSTTETSTTAETTAQPTTKATATSTPEATTSDSDDDGSGAGIPGFGIATALVALLAAALLAARRPT